MAKKKTKTFGKSSYRGVPKEEVLLATALQNAHAFGMKFCEGSAYKDAAGGVVTTKKDAVACCALGALWLKGTKQWTHPIPNIPLGNDNPDYDHVGPGPDLGRSFRDAMAKEGRA